MKTPLVNADWLRRNFDDPDLIILDGSPLSNKVKMTVRHPNLQILGARYFDLKEDFSNKESDLPNMMPTAEAFTEASRALGINTMSKIVIYDNLELYASPRVWWMLTVMGHKNVAVLDGGLNDWVASGGEVEPTSRQAFPVGDFTANYDAQKIFNAAQILENISSKDFAVIDARSAGRFRAEAPEPRANSKSGRIEGSYNLPFAKTCRDGRFLPKAELKALFAEMNLGDGPLVFSCGSGMTACIDIFAANLVLDNQLGLYDGSWSEWGDASRAWPVV